MDNQKILFILSMVYLCGAVIERDLLLTPKKGLQILGRTLYYKPPTQEINGTVPWEQTLKHVTFLTLFPDAARNDNLSDLREYKEFMESPYNRNNEEYPRFGDIITLARGRLEKFNGYRFVEGICDQKCSEPILATWRVQKIRHRDSQSGFRYEMKFSVTPLEEEVTFRNKHPLNENYLKSFILKEEEYPKSFKTLTRRSDSFETFSNEREGRIVNEIPRRDDNLLSHMPLLNIGEYLKHVPKASSKVGYLTQNDLPTTYRPNYRIQFTKSSESFEEPEEPKTVVTHHFHHHYFMKGSETSEKNDRQLFIGDPGAIRIVDAPNMGHLSPRYTLTTTTAASPPPSIFRVIEAPNMEHLSSRYTLTTTTAAPRPSAFYEQQVPLYIQSFPQEETTSPPVNTKPFRQSEQQSEEIRYSEPDPLYENTDNGMTSEFASAEIHQQVEPPSSQDYMKQDTIIDQQPPPLEHQYTHDPYVDQKQVESTTQTTKTTRIQLSTRRTLLPKNILFDAKPTTENPPKQVKKTTSFKNRNFARSTTEQPVLKWRPKPKTKPLTEKPVTEKVEENNEETVITVTPSRENLPEVEVLTQKSVSKSVSVKIGNHSQEISLEPETTTSIELDVNSTELNVTN